MPTPAARTSVDKPRQRPNKALTTLRTGSAAGAGAETSDIVGRGRHVESVGVINATLVQNDEGNVATGRCRRFLTQIGGPIKNRVLLVAST